MADDVQRHEKVEESHKLDIIIAPIKRELVAFVSFRYGEVINRYFIAFWQTSKNYIPSFR